MYLAKDDIVDTLHLATLVSRYLNKINFATDEFTLEWARDKIQISTNRGFVWVHPAQILGR